MIPRGYLQTNALQSDSQWIDPNSKSLSCSKNIDNRESTCLFPYLSIPKTFGLYKIVIACQWSSCEPQTRNQQTSVGTDQQKLRKMNALNCIFLNLINSEGIQIPNLELIVPVWLFEWIRNGRKVVLLESLGVQRFPLIPSGTDQAEMWSIWSDTGAKGWIKNHKKPTRNWFCAQGVIKGALQSFSRTFCLHQYGHFMWMGFLQNKWSLAPNCFVCDSKINTQ